MRLDVTNVDTQKLTGTAWAEPGTYHFVVDEIVEENEKGHFEARMTVLAGTPKDQDGRTHRETFYLTPASIGRLVQFAVALKLVTTEDVERAKATGEELNVDWPKAVGRQFCGRLSRKKAEDGTQKQYCELAFAIWAIDSKAAKGVPLDTAAAKAFLTAVGGSKQPAQTQQQAAKPPTRPAATSANGNGNGGKTATATTAPSDPLGSVDDLFG